MSAPISRFNGTVPDAALAEAAIVALRRLDRMDEAKPIIGGLMLSEPACERGCEKCYSGCALIPQRMEWWERELRRAGGVPAWAIKQDGIIV